MLGIAMRSWPDQALRNVVDAPVEAWTTQWRDPDNDGPGYTCGCLAHKRFGLDDAESIEWAVFQDSPDGLVLSHPLYGGGSDRTRGAYCALLKRFGIPRTVRAIKTRALDILLRRYPLDSRLVVLRAEVGT